MIRPLHPDVVAEDGQVDADRPSHLDEAVEDGRADAAHLEVDSRAAVEQPPPARSGLNPPRLRNR